MDIEVYREFMALAAHKSFVSAARDLNMSQPSLSRHMNALSNDLGCRLFYDTRPLSLTAAGEVVLKHAGKIIGDQANMLAELRSLPAGGSDRILILDLLHTNALYVGINEAVARAKRALDEFVIEGIATTIPFHKRVLDNEVFLAGDATTDFIETQMGDVL